MEDSGYVMGDAYSLWAIWNDGSLLAVGDRWVLNDIIKQQSSTKLYIGRLQDYILLKIIKDPEVLKTYQDGLVEYRQMTERKA